MARDESMSPIYMTFGQFDEETWPLGSSKLGGYPDLPASVKWPKYKGKRVDFLCQINLKDVRTVHSGSLLPGNGMLWFFFNEDCWGYDPDHKDGWKVIFSPTPGRLHRQAIREPRYDAASIIFSATERKTGLRDFTGQLLGYQRYWYQEGDLQLDCQLVSNGFNVGRWVSEEDIPPQAQELAKGARDWQYLLQFDDRVCALYFLIKKDRLEARDFESVWFQLETS